MVNPDRVAFTIFGKDIYWYGVLMAIGILIAIWLGTKEERRKNLPKDTILDCCLYMIPLGVVCARLYYVIFEWKYYSQHLIEVFYVWEGGLAFTAPSSAAYWAFGWPAGIRNCGCSSSWIASRQGWCWPKP